MYDLTNLVRLSLASNSISVVDDRIGRLSNLRSLNLSSNNLTFLPSEIATLTYGTGEAGLGVVGAAGGLESIPDSQLIYSHTFGTDASNLRKLVVSGNSLDESAFGDEFGNLENLETFSGGMNAFGAMPDFLLSCEGLRRLDLAYNTLFELPDNILDLPGRRPDVWMNSIWWWPPFR